MGGVAFWVSYLQYLEWPLGNVPILPVYHLVLMILSMSFLIVSHFKVFLSKYRLTIYDKIRNHVIDSLDTMNLMEISFLPFGRFPGNVFP